MKLLAVIPARGGSKGIPRKNMRLIGGNPLISYSIKNALQSPYIEDVVVTTDSEEIISYSQQFEGVTAISRNSELAKDAVTLDPVVYDALIKMEEMNRCTYDAVITLQPTSPLLTPMVLNEAISTFINSKADSLISVVNKPHLHWTKNERGAIVPAYKKRLNRQQLPPSYLETGAFLISKRNATTEHTRLGANIRVFEVPEDQATDIDSKEDWVVCEAMLAKKRVAFRVDGYKELGLGHIYRTLTLSYALTEHDIVFICNSTHRAGIEKLLSANMHVICIESDQDLLSWLAENPIDIFVNDLLDTSVEYVKSIKALVGRFVSFEDMGDGAREADAVINAIYEGAKPHSNTYTGKSFVCLRDEFLTSSPAPFSDGVSTVLVSFGGTDPLDLTGRLYEIARNLTREMDNIRFNFVLGPGYQNDDIVSLPKESIMVNRNVSRMSDHMKEAQIAISSQGRTTFELASLGVPTLVLAQNKREQLHSFAQMDNGFINLGLGSEVSNEDIESSLRWLIGAKSIRNEMHCRMLSNDLKDGVKRVKRIILGETL